VGREGWIKKERRGRKTRENRGGGSIGFRGKNFPQENINGKKIARVGRGGRVERYQITRHLCSLALLYREINRS